MDTRLVKAGVVAALGLILLVPTFNALNASYVEDVSPPPWMPTPPTPPDMTPPTDWKGKTPPGDMCPPPVFRNLKEMNTNYTYNAGSSNGGVSWTSAPLKFTVPNGTIALGGYVNYTNWQAATVRAALTDPSGRLAAQNETSSGAAVGFIPQRGSDEAGSFFMNSYQFNKQQPPKAGEWSLRLSVDTPVQFSVHTEFGLLLACGGLMSS